MNRLDTRPAGSSLPADQIVWEEDDVNIGPAGYVWSAKVYDRSDMSTPLVSKSTGFATSPTTVTIAWTATDLGSLPSGLYIVKLDGAAGSLHRLHEFELTLTP